MNRDCDTPRRPLWTPRSQGFRWPLTHQRRRPRSVCTTHSTGILVSYLLKTCPMRLSTPHNFARRVGVSGKPTKREELFMMMDMYFWVDVDHQYTTCYATCISIAVHFPRIGLTRGLASPRWSRWFPGAPKPPMWVWGEFTAARVCHHLIRVTRRVATKLEGSLTALCILRGWAVFRLPEPS